MRFECIADFGLLNFSRKDQNVYGKMCRYRELIREEFENWNLPIHKEEEGEIATLLGVEVGGNPPKTKPVEEKRWLAFECLWEMGKYGHAMPTTVESVVALTTWLFMLLRHGLSIFDQTYRWVRENREQKRMMIVPREVRRELLAAAVFLLLVGQDLTMAWDKKV